MTWLDHAGHGACEGPKRHFSSTGTRNMSFSIRVCALVLPLLVEAKAMSWTWCAFAMAFRPFLSRKRQSCEHGLCLRLPFPPACRGNGNHGNMACACESPFPLACRGKGNRGVPAIRFSPCLSRKGLPRDSAGLRGWGAHGALQGPEGLRGALQGFRRHGITRDRPKWRFYRQARGI